MLEEFFFFLQFSHPLIKKFHCSFAFIIQGVSLEDMDAVFSQDPLQRLQSLFSSLCWTLVIIIFIIQL